MTECRTPLEPPVSAVLQVSPPSPHKLSDVAVRGRGPRRSSRGLFPSVDTVSSFVSLTSFSLLHSFMLPVFSEHTVSTFKIVFWNGLCCSCGEAASCRWMSASSLPQ